VVKAADPQHVAANAAVAIATTANALCQVMVASCTRTILFWAADIDFVATRGQPREAVHWRPCCDT